MDIKGREVTGLSRLASAALGVVFAGVAVFSNAQAARETFDPSQACEQALTYDDVLDKVMVGMWVSGYLAATEERLRKVNSKNLQNILLVLEKLCRENPGARYSAIVKKLTESQYVGGRSQASVDGRALLKKFYKSDADYVALTAALKPRREDIHAVYAEPLASRLVAMYDALFQPGTAIRPKPEHSDLITSFTTTGKLRAGDPVLKDFPGGYKDVVRYLKSDVPIGRFKFVKSGESLGLAFDGLIFVNGRWVLMPKPWRALQ